VLQYKYKGSCSALSDLGRVLVPANLKPRKRLNQALDEGKVDQTMKKLQVVLMALVAVFALSAVAVSTASAETTLLAEWLVGGGTITTPLAIKATGSLKLTDTGTVFGSATVQCNGYTFHGTIGPNGTDELTSILNPAGTGVVLPELSGEAALCEGTKTCEKDASETEAWPLKLPILTML